MPKGLKGFQRGHKTFSKKGRFKKGLIPWNKEKKGVMPIPWNKGKKMNIIPWNKGKKASLKDRKNLDRTGTKHSEETRKKMSIAHKGEKSYLWKGGITTLVQQIRHCFKYRQWRSDIFTRDNFTCLLCGIRSGNGKAVYLIADHYPKLFSEIFYENKIKNLEEALVCEEFWNINNGRTLCKECDNKYARRK